LKSYYSYLTAGGVYLVNAGHYDRMAASRLCIVTRALLSCQLRGVPDVYNRLLTWREDIIARPTIPLHEGTTFQIDLAQLAKEDVCYLRYLGTAVLETTAAVAYPLESLIRLEWRELLIDGRVMVPGSPCLLAHGFPVPFVIWESNGSTDETPALKTRRRS